MTNRSFPRWSGPLVGAAAGLLLAFRIAKKDDRAEELVFVLAPLCGALAGCLLWVTDAPEPAAARPPTRLGIVLAVLAGLTSVLPFVGLPFGVAAALANRSVGGDVGRASRFGLGLSVVLAVIVLGMWYLPPLPW